MLLIYYYDRNDGGDNCLRWLCSNLLGMHYTLRTTIVHSSAFRFESIRIQKFGKLCSIKSQRWIEDIRSQCVGRFSLDKKEKINYKQTETGICSKLFSFKLLLSVVTKGSIHLRQIIQITHLNVNFIWKKKQQCKCHKLKRVVKHRNQIQ